jgi:hypothetical protein
MTLIINDYHFFEKKKIFNKMSFHLFFIADKYRCPLFFDPESNKLVKSLHNTILQDQYKFVVKFNFSQNSSIFINPYTGLLLSSTKNETKKVLDETTFFNSSVDFDYTFLEVELKNFRVLWCNESLVYIHLLDSKIMEKMNYNVKKGVFLHHSHQYIDSETNEIIFKEIKNLEQLKNPNIYGKKIIITLNFDNVNLSNMVNYKSSNIVTINNENENLFYEINCNAYLEIFSSSLYYNNIGFLTFTNISTLYTNTLIDIAKNLESYSQTIEIKLLSYCFEKGLNCILHRPKELHLKQILAIKNAELYNKNIWFIWSEAVQRQEKYFTAFSNINKFCNASQIFNHSNWKDAALEIMETHFDTIVKEKNFAFSLIYSDCNEMMNPISRYSASEESILPEFIISILIQLYLNKDLSKVLSREILDFEIEENVIQSEQYKLLCNKLICQS